MYRKHPEDVQNIIDLFLRVHTFIRYSKVVWAVWRAGHFSSPFWLVSHGEWCIHEKAQSSNAHFFRPAADYPCLPKGRRVQKSLMFTSIHLSAKNPASIQTFQPFTSLLPWESFEKRTVMKCSQNSQMKQDGKLKCTVI